MRKDFTSPVPYRDAFEVAEFTRKNYYYKDYMPGVERAAALAAIKQPSQDAFIQVMCEVFSAYEIRNPAWDGSIP